MRVARDTDGEGCQLTSKRTTHKCIGGQGARGVLRIRIHLLIAQSALTLLWHGRLPPVKALPAIWVTQTRRGEG